MSKFYTAAISHWKAQKDEAVATLELYFLKPVGIGDSDLYQAMKQIAETGNGPKEQIPSMGCNIKWFNN